MKQPKGWLKLREAPTGGIASGVGASAGSIGSPSSYWYYHRMMHLMKSPSRFSKRAFVIRSAEGVRHGSRTASAAEVEEATKRMVETALRRLKGS